MQAAGLSNSLRSSASGLVERLLRSKSDNTNKKYFGAFQRWERFITSHGHKAIPAKPAHVTLYLNHLLNQNSTYSVITSAVYSIKWAHTSNALEDPTEHSFVKALVESSKRTSRKPVSKKDPITSNDLIQLCEHFQNRQDLLVVRDLTMIITCFAGFLRFDEMKNLRCDDITLYDNYFSMCIRKSKTDQYRDGKDVVVCKGTTVACPLDMMLKYIELANIDLKSDDFLFKQVCRSGDVCKLIFKKKPISYTAAREIVKKRFCAILTVNNIGLHSLRAGGASMASSGGANERCLKRHGRWKGDVCKDGYVKDSLEKRLSVTKLLGI